MQSEAHPGAVRCPRHFVTTLTCLAAALSDMPPVRMWPCNRLQWICANGPRHYDANRAVKRYGCKACASPIITTAPASTSRWRAAAVRKPSLRVCASHAPRGLFVLSHVAGCIQDSMTKLPPPPPPPPAAKKILGLLYGFWDFAAGQHIGSFILTCKYQATKICSRTGRLQKSPGAIAQILLAGLPRQHGNSRPTNVRSGAQQAGRCGVSPTAITLTAVAARCLKRHFSGAVAADAIVWDRVKSGDLVRR
ncbi:hypothetical protein F5Y15DRAFT_181428 [Xylariaceae sp. FL0016]|nr:hypothetical protein F5Y15DRAFT_181428 [Xylariaceae sp. FL0016]